jgi:MoaA/NifB/PqqE/SkfB family radical SAM enzyme
MNSTARPTDTVIAITYRCDAKCQMCNIWQLNPQEDLSIDDYAKLPSSLRDINISGGEPFLRKDMVDIIKVLHQKCDGPRIVISTNGFRTERIIADMERLRKIIPNIGIGVSLDGIGETHDKIRGIEGSFDKAVATLRQLREREFGNVRLSFTAMAENTHEMGPVYDLANSLGFQFTMAVAQNSDIYFSTQENTAVEQGVLTDALGYVIKKELLSYHPKRWMRAYYESGSLIFNQEKRRILECRAAIEFFYLSPDGFVYPCLSIPSVMGDLKGNSFEAVWDSESANRVREEVRGCEECWMICTARSALMKNIPKVLTWIANEKLKAHFSR